MWCPQCGTDTRVLETDKLGQTVTRVRWCRNGGCRLLFETHEVVCGQVVRTECPECLERPVKGPGAAQAKAGASLEASPAASRSTAGASAGGAAKPKGSRPGAAKEGKAKGGR